MAISYMLLNLCWRPSEKKKAARRSRQKYKVHIQEMIQLIAQNCSFILAKNLPLDQRREGRRIVALLHTLQPHPAYRMLA